MVKKKSTTRRISPEEYESYFEEHRHAAYEHALDIRKFEIELYWKRASYFWAFIAATLIGFISVQASATPNPTKTDFSVILACLGIVFSYGWVCVNKGSKYWQENWEKHVDLLEDKSVGPLYKTVLSRDKYTKLSEISEDFITGPAAISVSKVNLLISWFVLALWISLLWYSLPNFDTGAEFNLYYLFLIFISVITCTAFNVIGKTFEDGYFHTATIRKSRIKPNQSKKPDDSP